MLKDFYLSAIYNTAPTKKTLKRFLNYDKLSVSDREMAVGAVSLSSSGCRYFNKTDKDILLGIWASTAVPVIFQLPHTSCSNARI